MAANITNDLDSQLASLNQLKAPGASKGKIAAITLLCVNNIQVSNQEQHSTLPLTRHVTSLPDLSIRDTNQP